MENAMICKECENDEFDEGDDGFFYCTQCGVMAEGIVATGVADEDFIGDDGGTRGAMYQHIHKRNQQSQNITPSQLRIEDSLRYSEFRSQFETEIGIQPSSVVNEKNNLFWNVELEQKNLEKSVANEPADFVAKPLSYEDYYDETRDRYVKGLLMMVTYQCDALVEKFNVTPLIIGLVGPICLRFVALSGVYDDDWADKMIHDSELQPEGEVKEDLREGKRRNRYKAEPVNFDGKRAVTIWVTQLRKSLPLSSSLAISFLACHKVGASVLPTDIVRWAQEGKIPYRTCYLKIREQMGENSAACPVRASIMFKPFQIVSAQMLEARAALIADIIGLPLPPVNFYGIATNYLKRLSIPEDKVLGLVRLIQNWSMPPDLYLSKNEHRLPTRVCVMSVLIVAIRMLYNINGFGVWERGLGLVDASEVDSVSEKSDSPTHDGEFSETKSVDAESLDAMKATEFDTEGVSETKSADAESSDAMKATEFDTKELLKNLDAKYYEVAAETAEYEKDLLSYLLHGQNEIFAGLAENSPDDTYKTVSNLWNGYDKKFQRFGTPKRGRDWEDDLSLNQLSLDNSKFSNGNNPSASPSSRSESRSMEHDLTSSEHHHQEEKSKEKTIERLITDMGENFFRYIQPRVKVKRLDYLQYVRKREDGALIYAAHADYFILLRVCARIAEIDVRNMHRGVLSFERRLAWIEKRIDQVLHLTPPFMTCVHCDGENTAEENDDDMVLSQTRI